MKKGFMAFCSCLLFLSSCCQFSNKSNVACNSCVCNKDSMQIVMNLPMKVKPEYIAAFKKAFKNCAAETLKEPGCKNYEVYQSFEDSTLLFITETWTNKGEHLKHMQTSHLKAYLKEIKEYSDTTDTRKSAVIYVCPNVN